MKINVHKIRFVYIKFVIAAFMIFIGLKASVNAAGFVGSGTQSDPYQIQDFEDFNYFFNSINNGNTYEGKYIEQTEDIHFPQDQVMRGMLYAKEFRGNFNGKGHAVYDIIEDFANTGLFGTIGEDAVVRNWALIGGTLTSRSGTWAGPIARRTYRATIENIYCSVNVNALSTGTRACGVIGCADKEGIFGNIIYDGTITAAAPNLVYSVIGGNNGPLVLENCKTTYTGGAYVVPTATTGGSSINNGVVTEEYYLSESNMESLNFYAITHGGLLSWKYNDAGDNIMLDSQSSESTGDELKFTGEGTKENPYLITNLDEFRFFFNYMKKNQDLFPGKVMFENQYFELTTDIEFRGESLSGLNLNSVFAGTFDGKGHVIRDIQIKGNDAGLFGAVVGENAKVINLGLAGGTVESTGGPHTASIVRRLAEGGTVANCFSTANVISNAPEGVSASGIVGFVDIEGKIENCYYGGTISIGSEANNPSIYGICYGHNPDGKVEIYNCYIGNHCATFDITGSTLVSAVKDCEVIRDLVADGALDKLNNYVENNAGYYYWEMTEKGFVTFTSEMSTVNITFEGEGTQESPYLIQNVKDFEELQRLIRNNALIDNESIAFEGLYFMQTDDLDFSGKDNVGLTINQKFGGIYNGNGYAIKNANVKVSNGSIFGTVENGKIMNLGVLNSTIKLNNGEASGTIARKLKNASVENCFSNSKIIGAEDTKSLSGLVGVIEGEGSVINSYFAGVIDKGNSTQTNYKQNGIAAGTEQANTLMENCYWISDIQDGYTNITTVNNSRSATIDEFTNRTILGLLNEYGNTIEEYVEYVMDPQLNIPVQRLDGTEEALFNGLYVDGYLANEDITLDKINWYQRDGKNYLLLPKLADRNHLIPYFETNYNATVIVKDSEGNELGTIVSGQETNLFANDDITICVTGSNITPESIDIKVMQSTIASLFIEVDGGDEAFNQINKDPNHEVGFGGSLMIADDEDNVTDIAIKKMKGRGNATWQQIKKPYQLKFDKKLSMLGMPEAKTWLLLTGYRDGSLIRTSTWFELCKELNMNYSVDYKAADIYVNNNYLGTYLVTSKVEVDPNRVNISKTDEFLVEIDNNTDDFQFNTEHGYLITVKSPDLEGATQEVIDETKSRIKAKLDLVESKLYNKSVSFSELEELMDLESFAKFYWSQELSENFDAMVGSCYIYEQDGKIHMGPAWDFDNSMNRSYTFTTPTVYYVLSDSGVNSRMKANWYRELMARPEFSDLVDKIYLDNQEAIRNMPNVIDEQSEYVKDSAAMNYIRWPYDEMKSKQPSPAWIANENSFEDAVGIFKTQVEQRIAFYENEYKDLKFEKVEYSYTNDSGEEIVGNITIPQEEKVFLNNVSNDTEITIVGITAEGSRRALGTVSLEEGKYVGDIRVSNTIASSKTKYKTANSATYSLEFEADEIKELVIVTAPEDKEYLPGEKYDISGIELKAVFESGKEEMVNPEDITIDPETITAEITEVTLAYGDKTVTLPVRVRTYLKGDVNLDGKVNSTDAAIVLDRFTVNKWTLGELLRGDMDENGVLNSSDAALILQLF